MARIVTGLGTSHSPHLNIGPDLWAKRGEEDQRHPMLYRVPDGTHVTYDELLEDADPGIRKEITPEVFQRRYEANQRGISAVAAALEEAAPDILVMVGDDQHEVFQDDNMPALAIYYGEQIPYFPHEGRIRQGTYLGDQTEFRITTDHVGELVARHQNASGASTGLGPGDSVLIRWHEEANLILAG